MKGMRSRRLVQWLVWILSALMVAPPVAVAQMAGGGVGGGGGGIGGAPVPFGLSASSQGAMMGAPIVTNPEALQPIIPSHAASQVPCPGQAGGAATAPALSQDPLNTADRLAAIGVSSAMGTMRQPGAAGMPGTAPAGAGQPAAVPGQSAAPQASANLSSTSPAGMSMDSGVRSSSTVLPNNAGLLSPLIQAQQAELQGNVGITQPGQIEPTGPMTIEDSFAKFFLLQGMTNQLKQYGYNYFDLSFSSFPQIMDMPIGPDYVLGPEDTLAIHIWNVPDPSFNRSYIGSVERDGMLFIPQVGSFPIAGATFGQAHQIIHAKLSGLLKRFDFHISMGRLRSIKVFVVGEVVRPGAYDLSSLSTVSHALYAACGPAKSGSLRHIKVIRNNKVVGDVDFYQFFLHGDRSHDLQLHSGDTILVNPIGAVAAIGGPVRRPAIYEILDGTTLPELVDLAGGLAPSAGRKRCQIFRVEAGQQRVILDVDIQKYFNGSPKPVSTGDSLTIRDGDFVRIGSVPLQIENAVTLTGAVRSPGVYELKPGMRMLDVVKPEQLLQDSYLDKAELVRTDPVTYETAVKVFSIKALLEGHEDNVELRRLDKIVVGSQLRAPWVVSLAGEIKRPGSYTLETGERLSSVLKRAGGLTSRAFPQGLVLMRDSVAQRQQAEISKFVALQKQRLTMEAAALSAGAVPTSGPAGPVQQSSDAQSVMLQMQALDQLMSRVQVGRVVLHIQSVDTLDGSENDVILEGGDQITIPPTPKTVSVIGAVRSSTNVLYREGFQLKDYLREAGGLIEEANEDGIYLVRANGSAEGGYAFVKNISFGDTIIVPEKIETKTKPLTLWGSIASIFSSLGIAAAALAVISKQ